MGSRADVAGKEGMQQSLHRKQHTAHIHKSQLSALELKDGP